MIPFLANTPIPRDLPLPLPLPEGVLIVLLVIFFLIHILFVNLMVGGSVLVTFFEWLGCKDARWDRLAAAIGRTITVNKSLAVVMGIGPLLCINLVYTMQWYSANTLTGHAWLMIVPLVIVAFLLTYLHKYKWESWSQGGWKSLHQLVSVVATLLLLFIPLIFLANVNLMLFPSEWEKVRGFFSSLSIGNVLPHEVLHLVSLCEKAAKGDATARKHALELEQALATLSSFDEGVDLVLFYKYLMTLEGHAEYALHFNATDTLTLSQQHYARDQLALFKNWYQSWSASKA